MSKDTLSVIGMIYGGHDIETITEFVSIDPETQQRSPEVRRITSLGIAHTLDTLSSLTTSQTHDMPMREFLDRCQHTVAHERTTFSKPVVPNTSRDLK